MNRTLAFLFVLAMTAAGIFAVKWQDAVEQMKAEARRAARETAVVQPAALPNQKTLLEVRRLEAELQSLRVQTAAQREVADAAHRREIELLRTENDTLQRLLTSQRNMVAEMPTNPEPVVEEIAPLEPVPPEEVDPVGLAVVDMYEFRALNWRQGTMPATGAAVISVVPGSPAMIAGIQAGDIILSLGNTTIDGPGTFNEKVAALLPGSATRVTFDRNRTEMVVMLVKPLK
jgi:hypothetical protein